QLYFQDRYFCLFLYSYLKSVLYITSILYTACAYLVFLKCAYFSSLHFTLTKATKTLIVAHLSISMVSAS
ncbi:hypothetical protein L9F63_002488, partial [Diploptera punctata]